MSHVTRGALGAATVAMVGLVAACGSGGPNHGPAATSAALPFVGNLRPSVHDYEDADREIDGAGLRIHGRSSPAGVFLTYALDPRQRYRLRLAGMPLEGRPILRIRFDNATPTWRPAPAGEAQRVIPGARTAELLIYGEQEFSYRLRRVEVRACPHCRTDADIRREILHDVPGLDRALTHDRKKAARLILDWSARTLNFAFDPASAASVNPELPGMTASEILYDLFRTGRAGVTCGGASVFTSKVMRLFGFDAFTFNFGDRAAGLTHVSVVVPFRHQGTWAYFFFDPTFNTTFRDGSPSGRYLTVAEMVRLANGGDVAQIRLDERPMRERKYLVPPGANMTGCDRILSRTRSFIVCRSDPFTLGRYFEWSGLEMGAAGYTPDLTGFMKLLRAGTLSVGAAPDAAVSDQFVSELESLGIPRVPA